MTTPLTRPGRLVAGRYRLVSQIGGGGMGTVWMAQDELLGRRVAVKQVLPRPGADPHEAEQQRQRALREGRIAARLSHPHAISVFDVALDGGLPWLVMEYLPSRSLATVLGEDGLLRVDQVAQIGAQVADALAATHAAGIVHRDVKPANILIGEGARVEGLVKITDFGISHASGDVSLTQTGQITGTPAFLAPEVAQGQEPAPPSDVFSLAATLYTCLEGQPPFGLSDNSLQQLHRVAGGEIIPPQRCGALTAPLLRMLAADPAARPSMTEVRDQLASLAAHDGDTTTVLMARTNLRSSAPGRQRTATFPPPAPTPAPAPAPSSPTPPPPPPRRPVVVDAPARPSRPSRPAGERRRGAPWLWVAAGALVTAALILGGVLLATAGRDDGDTNAGAGTTTPAAAPTSSAAVEPTTQSPAPATTTTAEPPPTTTASSAPAADVDAGDVRDFLRDYHQLVTDDPEEAWQLTGPTLRSSISEQGYVNFWSQFSDVRLSGVQAEDGSLTATGQLEFRTRDGSREREEHRFTLVVDEDGDLLLDSDVAI
ncbi:serine/threonine-protein kinase [Geodermatophilus sp. URMC 64]